MGLSGALRSSNMRGIVNLSMGTAVGQVVAIAVAPILTRLYSPSDFGTLAVFGASVAIGVSVATGSYEAPVSLPPETPEGERKAITLVRLANLIALVTALLGLVLLVSARAVGIDPWFQELGGWTFAIPLAVLSGCVSQTLMAYATRRRQYGRVAQVQPAQRIASALVQIGIGLREAGPGGLILGSIVAPFIGLTLLFRVYREGVRTNSPPPLRSGFGELRATAREYSDFPRVNLSVNLLNALAWNIQVLILGIFFVAGDVGQYSLAVTVASLPGALIVVSVSQVFQRELASRCHDMEASLALTKRVVRSLALVSVAPFLVLAAFGQPLFEFVFGGQWGMAGAIASAMVPILWSRFVSTTLSTVFPVYRRLGTLLAWQVLSLAITSGTYVLGSIAGLSIVAVTWSASLLTAPLYLALIPMATRVIRGGTPSQARPVPDEPDAEKPSTAGDPD